MQVLTDDGTRIGVRVDGQKSSQCVVLIHGFPFDRTLWDAQAEALARHAFVIRPDMRGAGSSSVPEGPYLMETLASDVAAVLDALGVERAALVGHSMGGYVALAFVRMFAERVSHLSLVSSRLRADTPQEMQGRQALAQRVERERSVEPVIEAYAPRLFSEKTHVERPGVVERACAIARRSDPAGAAAALRGMALRASSEDIAGDIGVPVLSVAGGSDTIIPLAEARDIAARFPRSEMVVCADCAHLAMLEEPDLVSAALAAWLRRS